MVNKITTINIHMDTMEFHSCQFIFSIKQFEVSAPPLSPYKSVPLARIRMRNALEYSFSEFLQERIAASQRNFVAFFETGDIVVVVRIPDDELAQRILRAEQLDLGFGVGWRPLPQLAHVLVVHAEHVVEGAKVVLGNLADLVRRVDAVLGQYLRCPLIHRRAHVPGSDGRAVATPLVLHAFLTGHVPKNGCCYGRPTDIAQTDEQYRPLGLLSHL